MAILFIGKRFYTNRDAFNESYGRIYQLPWWWAHENVPTRLWMVDYHGRKNMYKRDGDLQVISTPVRNLAVLWRYLREVWRRNRFKTVPDIVIASGDCYIGLMAYRLARQLGASFFFDVYDKYDEFGAYRQVVGFDPFRFLLTRADACFFASNLLMDDLGANVKKKILVPNGVDISRFRPLKMDACRNKFGFPKDTLLVGYFGGMERDRGVDDLIKSVQKLRCHGVEIELLLGGTARADMNFPMSGVRFLGNIPYKSMPEIIASCDLLAVPYRRSAFMDAGASNKIAEAMACGRPIVATKTPNLLTNFPHQAKQLENLLAKPNDPDDLARVLRLQIKRRVVVDMPPGFGWNHIASRIKDQLLQE